MVPLVLQNITIKRGEGLRKRGELPNGGIEKCVTLAYPEIGNQPWTFKGIKSEKKGIVKNKE